MKLYIATCTLNFNNILSTESISPADFYAVRGFGNKRFYRTEANNHGNVIMLYSKYPVFSVNNDDMENSPMVIEIETKDYNEAAFIEYGEHNGVNIYVSNKTIYLNPFHCTIWFQSYQDIHGTLAKAEQSLENKFQKLYSRNLLVRRVKKEGFLSNLFSEKDYFEWNQSFDIQASDIPSGDYQKDFFIDRVKGCLVGYLIGANSSVSPKIGRLRQLARKMKNILSAIVNSPEHKPTDIQDENLISCIKEFNSIYALVDPARLYNQHNQQVLDSKLNSPSTGLSKEDILKVLNDLGLKEIFFRNLNLKRVYDANDLYNCLYEQNMPISESYNQVINNLSHALSGVEYNEKHNRQLKDIDELISFNGRNVIVKDELKTEFIEKLFESLVNNEFKQFMEEHNVNEPIAIAFIGGALLKKLILDKWEGSRYQVYFNRLLAHLQQCESFDITSIDNDVLQGFAAFCQKGEDIDRLISYLQQCGFSNYKYALSIYGAARGFASLPKTFTSTLIDGDKTYYQNTTKRIWDILFGIQLADAQLPESADNDVILYNNSNNNIVNRIISNIDEIESKTNKQVTVISAVSKAVVLEEAVQSPKAFMYILDSFPRIKTTKAFKALDSARFAEDTTVYTPEQFRSKIYQIIGNDAIRGQKEKIDRAIALEAKRQDPVAFLAILDNFMKPNEPAYKRIAALLKNSTRPQVSGSANAEAKNNIMSSPNVGEDKLRPLAPTDSLFVYDRNVSYFILSRQYIPMDLRTLLSKKIIRFQEGYAPGGRYADTPSSNPVDNRSTIDHFKHWCLYKGKYGALVDNTPSNINCLDKLSQDLFERYAK